MKFVSDNKNRFPEIDFIKGIAIIWIVLFHIFRDSKAIFVGDSGGNALSFSHLILWGGLGVDLFVICSGFLLSHSYQNIYTLKQGVNFFFKRVQRLLPLYYIAIFFVLALDYLIGRDNFQFNGISVLLHLLCLHSFTGYIFDIEGAWWFMGMIIQLYILFPLIYKFLQTFNKFSILLVCAILTVIFRFVDFANLNTSYSLFAFLPTFVAGMLLYEYSDTESDTLHFIRIACCIISIGIMIYAMSQDILIFSFFYGLARPMVALGIFFLLSALYKGLSKICHPLTLLVCLFGLNSYAIYLFHRPFIFKYVTVVSSRINNIISLILFLTLMLMIGFVITKFEKQIFVVLRKIKSTIPA